MGEDGQNYFMITVRAQEWHTTEGMALLDTRTVDPPVALHRWRLC